MAKSETIKERLIRMETKQDNLILQFTNHLRHHWAVTLALLSTTASLITTVIVMLLKE